MIRHTPLDVLPISGSHRQRWSLYLSVFQQTKYFNRFSILIQRLQISHIFLYYKRTRFCRLKMSFDVKKMLYFFVCCVFFSIHLQPFTSNLAFISFDISLHLAILTFTAAWQQIKNINLLFVHSNFLLYSVLRSWLQFPSK